MSGSISAEQSAKVVEEYQRKSGDTGSPEVQTALLTTKIKHLTEHFKTHPKDKHSQRGLQAMINKRRSLLAYFRRKNLDAYRDLIKRLGLRGN